MTRDCIWPGCDRPEGPAGAGYCAKHHSADRREGTAPRMTRWDEFLWLTETMGVGLGEAARRLGWRSWHTLANLAYYNGRPDLRNKFLAMHSTGDRP